VLAVVLGVVTLGFGLASVLLDSLTHQPGTGGPVADAFTTAASVVPVTTVGTLLAARRPRNPIGWMLLALVLMNIIPTTQYVILDYPMRHGSLPLGWLAVVLNEFWPIVLFLVTLLLWLFPDGKLPGGRWHRPARVAAAGWLLVTLATSSRGVLAVAGHDVRIHTNGDLANPLPRALVVLSVVVIVGTLASWTAWLVIQIPTYRHASGERRQQLKWLYSGAAIFVTALIISTFIAPLVMGEVPGWGNQPAINALASVGTAALPVCMGVAVLKYRLYAIDRIISRVVSYTLITALLAGVFTGLILLATRVLPVKGSLAVALATLVIAALFNPLRKRVQHAVDRRFNRARYDAEAIVAAFTTRLRQTVDLATVRGDLVGVVHEAFQPAHISVWLSGPEQIAAVAHAARKGPAGGKQLG
jgi:multisubunit Na+/H+ antiporter MnhC subunit